MEDNEWYESIEKEIASLKLKIGRKDYHDYKLDYLKRVAQKVALFSPKCTVCHSNQQNILKMVSIVMDFHQMTTEQREDYFHNFRSVINHLEGHIAKPVKLSPAVLIIGSLMLFASIILTIIVISLEGNGASNFGTQIIFGTWAIGLFVIGLIILIVGFFIKKGER